MDAAEAEMSVKANLDTQPLHEGLKLRNSAAEVFQVDGNVVNNRRKQQLIFAAIFHERRLNPTTILPQGGLFQAAAADVPYPGYIIGFNDCTALAGLLGGGVEFRHDGADDARILQIQDLTVDVSGTRGIRIFQCCGIQGFQAHSRFSKFIVVPEMRHKGSHGRPLRQQFQPDFGHNPQRTDTAHQQVGGQLRHISIPCKGLQIIATGDIRPVVDYLAAGCIGQITLLNSPQPEFKVFGQALGGINHLSGSGDKSEGD